MAYNADAPTHHTTKHDNRKMQDKNSSSTHITRTKGPGSEFTRTISLPSDRQQGEYEDCGPYGANIPCYSNGEGERQQNDP